MKIWLYFCTYFIKANYYQVTYEDCELVSGYWSEWSTWSNCKCKKSYNVKHYGQRYVKERERKCYCGVDGVETGCHKWCGKGFFILVVNFSFLLKTLTIKQTTKDNPMTISMRNVVKRR